MTTLNEVTQRLDGSDYNTYKTRDLVDSISEMTEDEISGLKERREYLDHATRKMDYNAPEQDELLKLNSMFLG